MIQIGDTLISDDLVTRSFTCDLEKCKGACCVLGDSGAPLDEKEKTILDQIFSALKPFMSPEGLKTVEKKGTAVIDGDKELVTPLIDGKECAFAIFENGIARCAIEKAFMAGAVSFRKPISCFLYPIRIKKNKVYDGVNYDIWPICDPARILGESLQMPVYVFAAQALREKYGDAWYEQLKMAAEEKKGQEEGTREKKKKVTSDE